MQTTQKNKNIYFLLMVYLIISFSHVFSAVQKWQEIQPFYSTEIMSMAKHPGGKIFVGTVYDGIYVSGDKGRSWSQCYYFTTSILKPIYQAMFIDNLGNIYASGAEEGLIKSSDVGVTWINCNFPAIQGIIFSITGDSDGNIYVGTTKGTYFSSDLGSSWTNILDSSGLIVRTIIFKDNIIYAFIDQIGIYITKDKGKNWSLSQLPQSSYWGALVINENEIYVAMHDPIPWFAQGIYKTKDGGKSWAKIIQGLSTDQINTLSLNSDNQIIAGGILGRVFKSVNGGTNWTELSFCNTIRQIKSFLINGNQIIAGTDGGGAIITENGGTTWQFSNNGFPKSQAGSLIKLDDATYLISNGAGVFKFNSASKQYTPTNNLSFIGSRNKFGDLPEQAFNGFVKTANNSILACTYQGLVFTWDNVKDVWVQEAVPNNPCMISSFEKKDNDIYITVLLCDYGIFHSADNGQTWESLGFNMRQCHSLAFDKPNNIIFAGMCNWLYYSTDNGKNWDFNRHAFVNVIYDVKISASKDIYVVTNDGIEKSTDNGATWVYTSFYNCIQIKEIENGHFLLATAKGFYESVDNGNTWQKRDDGLKDSYIKNLLIDTDGRIYAITNSGFYFLDSSESVASVENNEIPITFKLLQNYPNPFNPTTVIRYTLAESGHATLKVYNILSQEVVSLVDDIQSGGVHQVNFNARNLPAGVYIARLQSGGKVMTIKLQLVK